MGAAPAASLLAGPPSTGRDAQTRPYLKSPPTLPCAPHAPGAVCSELHWRNRRRCPPPPAPGLSQRSSEQTPGSVCLFSPSAPRPGEPFGFPRRSWSGAQGEDEEEQGQGSAPRLPAGPAVAGRCRLGSSVPALLSRRCQPCPCRCGCPYLWGRKEGRKDGREREGEGKERTEREARD